LESGRHLCLGWLSYGFGQRKADDQADDDGADIHDASPPYRSAAAVQLRRAAIVGAIALSGREDL